jgi:hypothetical protein
MKTMAEYVQIHRLMIAVYIATRPTTNSTGMQTGQATEGGSFTPLVVGTAYGFGRPRRAIIYPLLHGGGVCLMGTRRWLICVSLNLALIIVIRFLGGGHVQQALVRLSIGNGPLYPEDKITHIPLLKTGALASTHDLFYELTMKKLEINQGRLDQLQLLATILTQWGHLVASNKVLDLLYWAMRTVLYWRTASAIQMAILFGTFFCRCFICCCPGGRWGNTEQVVARWRRPVASRVALDMLHWVMCFVLHRHTAMAIKTTNNGGTCLCHC